MKFFRYSFMMTLTAGALILGLSSFSLVSAQGYENASKDRLKISRDLAQKKGDERIDVIVQFTPGRASEEAIRANAGQVKVNFHIINGMLASVPARALEGLAHNPNITYISPDRELQGSLEYANPTVGAELARSWGWTGDGIGVAIIDSGISDHPDFKELGASRVVYNQSFIAGGTGTIDAYGHGTHVAGIVGGNGSSSTSRPGHTYTKTFVGIAPKATLINLQVLNGDGTGTDSAVIAAIQRAIELKSKYNIRVINLSLGRPVIEGYETDPLCQAVETAWKAGIVVVVAAGNDGRNDSENTNGYATIESPGNDPYVITVGAMKDMSTSVRADDLIASYSSKGPTLLDHVVKPDLVAPGNRIISALAPNSFLSQISDNRIKVNYFTLGSGNADSNYYMRLSGTSMAAPMVSGAVALLLNKTPELTPAQLKARLMKTASKSFPSSSISTDPVTQEIYTSCYDIFTVGAGYLDIVAALNNADLVRGPALSPRAVYNPLTHSIRLQNGALSGGSIVWGDFILWGNSLVWGDTLVWGDSMVWGDVLTGQTLVWGDSLVWGDTLVWGDSRSSGEAVSVEAGEN